MTKWEFLQIFLCLNVVGMPLPSTETPQESCLWKQTQGAQAELLNAEGNRGQRIINCLLTATGPPRQSCVWPRRAWKQSETIICSFLEGELACYNSCRCDSLLAKPLAALHAVRGAADAFFPSFRPEPSCKLQTSSLVTQLLAGCFMPNSHPYRVSQPVTHLNAPRNNS